MEGGHPLKKHGKNTHKKRKKEQDFGIFLDLCPIFTTAGPPFARDACRKNRHRNHAGMMECAMERAFHKATFGTKAAMSA